jgi:hypothetical protein
MAELMCNSDLGVGAAGMTSWERCCLGLPSIVLVMAENQRLGATALASAGAALIVHDTDEIGSALRELLLDPIRLSRMSAAAFAITDGGGARRSVTALLGENDETANVFALRPANADDAELLWLWRNDPTTRTQSRNTDPIAWRDHSRWFAETLAIPSTRLMIADRNGTPAGMIRFDRLDDGEGVQVNISVAPDLRPAPALRARSWRRSVRTMSVHDVCSKDADLRPMTPRNRAMCAMSFDRFAVTGRRREQQFHHHRRPHYRVRLRAVCNLRAVREPQRQPRSCAPTRRCGSWDGR